MMGEPPKAPMRGDHAPKVTGIVRRMIEASFALVCGCGFVTGPLVESADTDGETGGTTVDFPPPIDTTTGRGTDPTSGAVETSSGEGAKLDLAPESTDGDGSSCCAAHQAPGCDEPRVAACVCDIDRSCCDETWDAVCVEKVEAFGCGACTDGTSGSDGTGTSGGATGEPGSCCEVSEAPGCTDPDIEACVCAYDQHCCDVEWDSVCVDLLFDAGCGPCPPPDTLQPCCQAGFEAGCADAFVEACVCESLPSCCTNQWSQTCAEAVEALQCGSCTGGYGSCCEATVDPGCEDEGIATCVCTQDPYCCDVAWDGICVNDVDSYDCGTCLDPGGGTGPATGTGSTSA